MKRALIKMGVVLICVLAALAVLIYAVSSPMASDIKYNLSGWMVVALVLIVNLASFASFLVLYTAWRWIKCDLRRTSEDEDLK